jgi:hypothetical protein
MEKAKQTGAPPPAIRPQPNGDLTLAMLQDKPLPQVPQPRNDMSHARLPRTNSTVHRPQDDPNRPVNSVLHNTGKVPPKRPLQQDAGDEHHSRSTTQRNPPSYHNDSHHSKRRKTSEDFEDDDDATEPQPKMKAPPIRQSSIRQKVCELYLHPGSLLAHLSHRMCQPSQFFLAGTPMRRPPPTFKEALS